MNAIAIRRLSVALAACVVLVAGCSDDDPVTPTTSPWREVPLELAAGNTQVVAVDVAGDHGLALALVLTAPDVWIGAQPEFFRLQADGRWLPADLGSFRAGFVPLDIAVDAVGRTVLAGAQMPGPSGVVLDLRTSTPFYADGAGLGLVAVDGDGALMVAGGYARGGTLVSSPAPDDWAVDDLPLTGTNDAGLVDIDIRGGHAVACGFDDGADTLQVILSRNEDGSWEKIPVAGPGTRTLQCIALSDAGTIFVGGIEGAGGPSPRAFLTQRTANGLWAELLLPDPERLHGVEDILVARDGSIYLACMGEGDATEANLVHGSPSGTAKEIEPFPGGLLQLAETADGSVVAVGFRRAGDGTTAGVMLVRDP